MLKPNGLPAAVFRDRSENGLGVFEMAPFSGMTSGKRGSQLKSRGLRRLGSGARLWLTVCAVVALGLVGAVPSAAAVKAGTSGPDTLVGTAQADTLRGLGGNDKLSGKAANDKLQGGAGADRLTGGPAGDMLLGEGGNDQLLAEDGTADTVNCGPGKDLAKVDEVDRVAANCERVEGLAVDAPPAPVPPAAAAQLPPTPESPPKEKEEEGGEEGPEEEWPEPEFEELPLAMFPATHGWTNNGVGVFSNTGGPFIVNDGNAYKIETNGLGSESVTTSPALEPVDFRHSHVSFHSQVSFSDRLGVVKLRLASGNIATDYAEVTIWREDFDPIALGSTYEFQTQPIGAFDVSGKVDWSAINRAQVIVTDNDKENLPVTLYMAGIYAVPTSQKATISFAFDDGDDSAYTRALSKLSTYRFPATAYVIADVVGDPGWLTLEQLYKLRNQHHWEIGAHSYTLAAHEEPGGLDDLEPAELKVEMDSLRAWMDENGFRRDTIAYPKGGGGHDVRFYAARDYCAGRATARGPETIPPRDNYTMRGWSINGLQDGAASAKAEIDNAVAQGSWLMLSFHELISDAAPLDQLTKFREKDFITVVDYVRALQKEGKVRVRTVRDALGSYC